MTDIKQLAKDFVSLNGYPLKNDDRIKEFTKNDKRKLIFLESLSDFNTDNPNLNYYELGQEIKKNNKKTKYFDKRFEGLIQFINNQRDEKALEKMLTGYKNQPKLKDDITENYQPQRFEVVSEDEKVIYVIPPPAKKIPKTDKTAGMGAGAFKPNIPPDEDIRSVMTPRMRGSVKKPKDDREDIITKMEKIEEIEREQKEKEEKLKEIKTDSMGNVIESEDDPRVLNEEEETKEEERPPATATPATMSPDERDKVELEDIEFKVDTDKEINLDDIATDSPENLKAQAEAEAKLKAQQAQQVTMTLGKGSATGKVEEKAIQDIPQDIRAIPKERASTTGKSEAQLKDDLNYFFNTYPDMLKKQKGQFMTILRGKSPALRKKQFIELHRRIVGLVGNVEDISKDIGKQIGIVLNADKYLDDKINAILLDKITKGMNPAQLVVDVTDKTKDDKSKRIGSYQITKGRSGLLNAQKAPVYRSIPSTNDSQDRRSGRPIKLKTLPTQRWDEVNTAKKQMRLDPFEPKRDKVNRFDIYL